MNANTHGYPYQPGDIAYVIAEDLTIREGTCVSDRGEYYCFRMADTNEQEPFTFDQLYGTKSNAQIAVQTKYTSPTPSVSRSVTPTPSRTPQPSSSATITPTPSSVVYPNLAASASWNGSNGTVTANGPSVAFKSTGGTGPVVFNSIVSVEASTNYHFSVRYTQGTCRYATIEVLGVAPQSLQRLFIFSAGNNNDIVDSSAENSGTITQDIFIPSGITQVKVLVTLFQDSNYKRPAQAGFTYNFGNILLQKFVPYVAPSPTPSAGGASYDSVVLAKNPIHYWPFNSNLTDVVAGDNLTLEGDSTLIKLLPDSFGNILSITDDTDFNKQANFASAVSLSSNFSLEAWVNIEEFTPFNTIFGTPVYGFQYDSTGKLFLYNTDDSVTTADDVTLAVNGLYYHLVVTVDSGKNVIFYVDGVAYPADTPLTDTYQFDRFGNDGNQEQFLGRIGNPAIYNHALTQSEVLSNFNAGQNNYRYKNMVPTPGPSPTPTPSPTAVVPHLFNFMARLNSSAMIDPTFVDLNISNVVSSIVQTNDGKIYLGGNYQSAHTGSFYNLGRLNTDGSLDMSYQYTSSTVDDQVRVIKQTSDGKIYVGGNFKHFFGSAMRGLGRLNSDGTFDNTFVDLNLSSGTSHCFVTDIIETVDGKIYIAAQTDFHESIFRMNSDGTLDNTYTEVDFNWINNTWYPKLHQAASGKIYVTGQFSTLSGEDNALARLNSDGTLDNSYSSPVGGNNQGDGFLETADGKIYLYGFLNTDPETYPNGNGLIRLNADGSLDTDLPQSLMDMLQQSTNILTMYQTTDDKIYCGGLISLGGNNYNYFVRLNSDGSVDNTLDAPTFYDQVQIITQTSDTKIYVYGGQFATPPIAQLKYYDSTGTVTSTPLVDGFYSPIVVGKLSNNDILISNNYEVQSNWGVLSAIGNPTAGTVVLDENKAVLETDYSVSCYLNNSDGTYYIGGGFSKLNGQPFAGLARLLSDGSIDSSFTPIDFPANTSVFGILKSADGKIYVVGNFQTVGSDARVYIVRLNSDGSYDNTFVDPGLSGGSFVSANTIVQANNGKIYVGGSFTHGGAYLNFIRLNSDGTFDNTFTDMNLNGNSLGTLFKTSTGKIYVTGDFTTFGGQTYTSLARLNADGTLDTTFADIGTTGMGSLIELSNGKFMITGSFAQGFTSGGLANYTGLARLNSDGTPDLTFVNVIQNYQSVSGIALQSGDNILVSGAFQTF